MSVIEIRAPFFHGRFISANCLPLSKVPSLDRARQAFDAGQWGAAVHHYKIAVRSILNGRRERTVGKAEMTAARNLQIARERLAAQLKEERSSGLPPQLIMVHVSPNYGQGGELVAQAHRSLLEAIPPEQVSEVSAGAHPYLGHRGTALWNDATDHCLPGRLGDDIVLTGGGFGDCHYNDFRARVDQGAENAFLLGRRINLRFHFVGDAIFYSSGTGGAGRGYRNLHERREADLEQLSQRLRLYCKVGEQLEPGFSLPIDLELCATADRYLRTSYRG